MKKFLVAATVFAVNVQVHALTPSQFQNRVAASVQKKIGQPTVSTKGFFGPEKCTDFAGAWQGSCRLSTPEGDTVTPEQISVHQDKCSSLQVNSEKPMNLGSVQSTQGVDTFLWGNFIMIADWNPDATEVLLKLNYQYKITLPTGQQGLMSGGGRIFLDGDKLVAEMAFADSKQHCEYQKVR